MKSKIKKVFILDDHPVILAALAGVISSIDYCEIIGQADNALDGLRGVTELKPDLLITDLNLGAEDGFDLIHTIRELSIQMAILVFTVDDELRIGSRVLREGADGILMKGAPIGELREAISTVLEGKKWASPSLTQRILGTRGGEEIDKVLSRRELQVFKKLGRGDVVKSIAADLGVSVKTVGSHCENIKKKLEIATVARLRIAAHDYLFS